METKPKNRAWVKDAAIVFLVVLLLLTFFSNTIMNHSLPEVATQMVTDGTITAKVRGTGTVAANGSHKVKAKANETIGRVMVKAGQEVSAGDVLFVLGPGDSDQLEEAKAALDDLQTQYAQAALSVPMMSDYTGTDSKIKALNKAVTEAQRAMNDLGDKLGVSSERIQGILNQKDTALTDITNARAARDRIENVISEKKIAADSAKQYYDSLKNAVPPVPPTEVPATEPTIEPTPEPPVSPTPTETLGTSESSAQSASVTDTLNLPNVGTYALETEEVEKARLDWENKQNDYEEYVRTTKAELDSLEIKINALEVKVSELNKALDSISYGSGEDAKGWADYLAAQKAYEQAVADYNTAVSEKNHTVEAESRSIASASVGLGSISNKIKRQQEKIKQLTGEGDENTVTANVSGTVTEVNCTAGDAVLKDDILCAIEVPDMGYTVSFSVTNDQAKRLHVGDTATISNYYWGNQIVATLSTIQTDKKNPMSNKLLTFDLDGDVTSGSEITVSVGQKSARYDLIIPNSAIRTDSNGSFVLAVMAKSSPLGNRYVAKRVAIEVLAADDANSAVTADLSNGDYVITTSSAPIANGDMVRMADAQS